LKRKKQKRRRRLQQSELHILFLERQFDLHAMLMILLHVGRAAEKKIADEREMAAAE
jgi:hypothetical protein